MPEEYQGESEASTASKKARLKIKKKKEERDAPPVRRGLKNPRQLLMLRAREQAEKDAFKRDMKFLRLQMERKEFPFGREAEKERKRNEKYKKEAKRQDRMS